MMETDETDSLYKTLMIYRGLINNLQQEILQTEGLESVYRSNLIRGHRYLVDKIGSNLMQVDDVILHHINRKHGMQNLDINNTPDLMINFEVLVKREIVRRTLQGLSGPGTRRSRSVSLEEPSTSEPEWVWQPNDELTFYPTSSSLTDLDLKDISMYFTQEGTGEQAESVLNEPDLPVEEVDEDAFAKLDLSKFLIPEDHPEAARETEGKKTVYTETDFVKKPKRNRDKLQLKKFTLNKDSYVGELIPGQGVIRKTPSVVSAPVDLDAPSTSGCSKRSDHQSDQSVQSKRSLEDEDEEEFDFSSEGPAEDSDFDMC